ncbi:glycosyl transferase family protein [Candidatus Omnitrophus magneticus]|uniref:Glycosyl transferase family protein n=1 Tax=Candidatus Omnitrophus magneticus TaxID=1609969 RepID=A0A0F0CPM0_9BACT|nr:glycosyl transferase family protein [Candidatus Omnitrophus magneticus]
MNTEISIIVPVYNEETNVPILYNEITSILKIINKSYEILFINDGSTDGTLNQLQALKKESTTLKIINFTRNFGQTPALMAGFNNASGKILITLDGDLQNDPKDIPILLNKINEGYDLVTGWRKNRKDNLFVRTIPSKIANKLINKMLKTTLHDYGCTLKAYKQEITKDLALYGEMHRFIPAIAVARGAKIAEIIVNHRPRIHGKTKYNLSRTGKVLLDLLFLSFLNTYGTKPIRFFGSLSILSFFGGIVSTLVLIYMKIMLKNDMTGNPLLILSALCFLMSLQLISIGFLGEIEIRTYYESQDKKTYYIKEII